MNEVLRMEVDCRRLDWIQCTSDFLAKVASVYINEKNTRPQKSIKGGSLQ